MLERGGGVETVLVSWVESGEVGPFSRMFSIIVTSLEDLSAPIFL